MSGKTLFKNIWQIAAANTGSIISNTQDSAVFLLKGTDNQFRVLTAVFYRIADDLAEQ